MVAALRRPEFWGVPAVDVFETHISTVIVAGGHAYKLKKPVALGFVDFTALADRHRFCEAEVRLNRRLAPQLYLDVVRITGTPDDPAIGGRGRVIDYAVRMRAFPQDALATNAVARGDLHAGHVDTLAADIARFHAAAAVAPASSRFGVPACIESHALANLEVMRALPGGCGHRSTLDLLQHWTRDQCVRLHGEFGRRQREGMIREGHGDLHLRNVVLQDDGPRVFDCIEFNDELRWIDVQSEIAFLAMDLHAHGRSDLAHRFVNAYVEASADHAGLAVLPFYLAYRALVRAKVAAIRAGQLTAREARDDATRECRRYLRVACGLTAAPSPALLITHGVSGSGKTAFTQPLLERIGAVRIRTDVERKRICGVALDDHDARPGLYTAEITRRTYRRAADLARTVVRAGFTAIVDGTFLARWQRDLLRDVARELHVPFAIVAFDAPADVLRARVEQRAAAAADASDANLAVLAHQVATREALQADERSRTVTIATAGMLADAGADTTWQPLLAMLRG